MVLRGRNGRIRLYFSMSGGMLQVGLPNSKLEDMFERQRSDGSQLQACDHLVERQYLIAGYRH